MFAFFKHKKAPILQTHRGVRTISTIFCHILTKRRIIYALNIILYVVQFIAPGNQVAMLIWCFPGGRGGKLACFARAEAWSEAGGGRGGGDRPIDGVKGAAGVAGGSRAHRPAHSAAAVQLRNHDDAWQRTASGQPHAADSFALQKGHRPRVRIF